MSSEYLYTNDQTETITSMEIKHKLTNIEDTLYRLNLVLKEIAESLANMRQETYVVTPEDEESLLH